MLMNRSNIKLTALLALMALAPLACNNQKAELTEEEVDETLSAEQSDAAPNRDNRSAHSGDAAFIKIFPDGDIIPSRGESVTASVPSSAVSTPAPASAGSTTTDAAAPKAETQQDTSTPIEESTPSSAPADSTPTEETPAPAAETPTAAIPDSGSSSVSEISGPAPDEQLAPGKESEDSSRPVLAVNESSASQLISVLPKENKATVSIGKHNDFKPGPYAIFAKWTAESKKVKVQVASEKADKDCEVDEGASDGEWKSLGVFYLTKNAKVVITNSKNSSYAVKNELLLKPVIAENLTKPTKFKCLGGQIDGHGLVSFE